jgi:hypothetical protein
LSLPVAAGRLKEWRVPGVEPRLLRGRLIQPREYNAALREGLNKAELELEAVGALLREVRRPELPGAIVVDRLGGRRYYHAFLQELWSDALVLIDTEMPYVSIYRAIGASAEQSIGFCVDGESRSPLTAVASCVAKYARELHMLLLNRWWSGRHPALRPTAGYTRDARRWMADLGDAALGAFRDALVRNGPAEPDADEAPERLAEA